MTGWLKQLRSVTAVNFYGYLREPAIIFWALVFPAGIAGVLGVAFQGKPPEIPIALISVEARNAEQFQGRRFTSEDLQRWKLILERASAESAGQTGLLGVRIMKEKDARLAIKRGEIQLYASLLRDSEYDLSRAHGESPENAGPRTEIEPIRRESSDPLTANVRIRAHYDPNNPEARLSVLALQQAVQSLDKKLSLSDIETTTNQKERPEPGGRPPELPDPDKGEGESENARKILSSVPLDSIGGRYIDFLIPGLLALGIMNSCMWGVGYGLIDLRVKKLLRRMAASPMHKSAFLASHFMARLAFTLSEALLLFGFSTLLFGVSIQGSLLALLLLFLAGNVAWSGIGILGSSRARSMHAANGIVNAVTLPLTMLSGIFFSYRNFPEWSQSIIEWLPLTLLADNVRAVFIEGAGIYQVLLPSTVLALTGIVAAAIGLKIYKWH